MILYRLAKTKRADDLTGEGAKRVGGRWNHSGIPVLYTAESGALAILEVLQYAQATDVHNFSMLVIEIPDDAAIQRVSIDSLPENWHEFPHLTFTKDIGQHWINEALALLLQVPSAVYPHESNWLINPLHADSKRISIVRVDPFSFSERLFGR